MEALERDRTVDLALNARVVWAVLVSGNARKRGGKWSIRDFMPQPRQAVLGEPKSPQDLLALAVHYNKMLGGKDLRGEKRGGDDTP